MACVEKTTAQIDYEHDYDYAHDSQNSNCHSARATPKLK
ncbi:MAG: hypothetical protein GQF41_0103 [Candidatus Rifleibacterium amylolyticum]|nr:MAG: hypothetical protein GQF41_0103 [Candidatus Rifleibacterium amylolyticum]